MATAAAERQASSTEVSYTAASVNIASEVSILMPLRDCERVKEGYVGPLERTALRRGRYRETVNWSVHAAGAFNICSVLSLGSYAVRGNSPWRELYFASTAMCVAYTLASLWSRREKPGEHFKAFVLQEGFVYSCMLEMFTWTWISTLFTLFFVVVAWGSLLFHFTSSSLPGSRQYLWSFAYFVNLPTFLRLDPLTSTTTFKSAAVRKGYPGVAFTHVGFLYRFVHSAISCPLILLAWLLVCAPNGLFYQFEFDMYFLYAQAIVLTALLLLVWLPRYANTVKSREVLEEQCEMANPKPSSTSSTSLTLMLLPSKLWGSSSKRAVAKVTPSPVLTFDGDNCMADLVSRAATAPPGAMGIEEGASRGGVAFDVTGTDYTLPSNLSCHSHVSMDKAMPLPGGRSFLLPDGFTHCDLPGPRSPLVASTATAIEPLGESSCTGERKSMESSEADAIFAAKALMKPTDAHAHMSSKFDAIVKSFVVKSPPARSDDSSTWPTKSRKSVSSTGIPAQHDSEMGRERSGRWTSARTFRISMTGVVGDEAGRSFQRDLLPDSSYNKKSEHVFAKSLGERPRMKNEAACFGERARDNQTASGGPRIEILGCHLGGRGDDLGQKESSNSPTNHYIDHAMRASGSPIRTLVAGVMGLPHGAYMLCVNVTAAFHHFKDNWRWWAASKTDKFLVTTGYMVVGMMAGPTVELPITSNVTAMILTGMAMAWVLVLNSLIIFGKYRRVSEAMILAEVSKGGNIGSGLVYSTASILNALTFGEPVEQGFVATEAQLVHAAVISCRWDTEVSWELEVCEGGGRTRTCRVMVPRIQLYRAALAARARGCDYMWVDSMSVPQPSTSDPPEVANAKTAAIRRLIPTMTAVYASAKLVLVLETACGREDGPDAYSKRTWTLQECVINQNTELIHLDGRHTVLGDAASRRALSGLADDGLADGMDDLASYSWVLEGEARAAAARTTLLQRQSFPEFADSRMAWRAADKAVALGQIFFRVLFEHVDVATEFMMEVATLLAKESEPSVTLIDNTGWDHEVMTGSACKTRYLMGRPSVMEAGPPAIWHIHRVPTSVSTLAALSTGPASRKPADDSANVITASDGQPHRGMAPAMLRGRDDLEDIWWLCEIMMQGQQVPLAVLPGQLHAGGHVGHLRKLRTCTAKERAIIMCSARELEPIKILWM
uniref:Heterokaryon incompatibility domain-containing protein n=1 Tax=Tetraselmis chuii TaxID=63592 RepID=A0A7S1SR15_9CHLO|mmetsp:Transcript_24639/g.43871  ORF Transcript_24639/g.43871 Transcript_24639/m.43871 type:complete len:1176 (+) Transcript_24639:212-3739(+)